MGEHVLIRTVPESRASPSVDPIRVIPERVRHPLAEPVFRELWSANVVSNIGTWMQTVGGAWLMTTLTADALPVALMSTATTLPALLVGLPAGSLADRVDRRRLLLATQAWMLLCASLLAVLTVMGVVALRLPLLWTFTLGIGVVVNGKICLTRFILPEVVSRPQMPTAIIMNSAGYNIARALGPAVGGFVVAASGPAATFMVNAASFLATLGVIFRWRPATSRAEKKTSSDETFVRTIVTGLQYAWQERSQRIVLTRSTIWMLCASAFWGLVPLVARRQLDLEATVRLRAVDTRRRALAPCSDRSRYPGCGGGGRPISCSWPRS